MPEDGFEFLAWVITGCVSMALSRHSVALDIIHCSMECRVDSITVITGRLRHCSRFLEALEMWLSLFMKPHLNFPSFGLFVLHCDVL